VKCEMCAKQEQVYNGLCVDCNVANSDDMPDYKDCLPPDDHQPKVNKEYLHAQMKFHELQAMWWMHAASNGHAATRKVSHGLGGLPFTKEELRDNAMQIAKSHMDAVYEIGERLGEG